MVKKNKNNNKDFSKKVMQKIKQGKVQMKPKIYFIFASLLLGLGFFASCIIAVFLINAATFHVRMYKPFEYLHFGKPGYLPFLYNFPWLLLMLVIAAITTGILMLKKYDISYKKSFLGAVVVLILLIVSSGIAFSFIAPQKRFLHQPPIKVPWQNGMMRQSHWLTGKIISFDSSDKTFTLLTDQNTTIRVSYTSPPSKVYSYDLKVGQVVRIIGKRQGDLFIADFIKPTRANFQNILPPHSQPRRGNLLR